MTKCVTCNLSNDNYVLSDEIDTTNNSNEIDNHSTSEISNTFIRYPPLIYNAFAALAIHDIKTYKYFYVVIVLVVVLNIFRNGHNLNIYNNRPKRYKGLHAMFKLTTSKAYGTELDSNDEEL
ncbi:hypothetical protein BJ944DRAFT_235944 [Cunninghamella echinulata]|nr:hypothetical protein BJ944DRAFT_235944 [Cunninghamella echinulata]